MVVCSAIKVQSYREEEQSEHVHAHRKDGTGPMRVVAVSATMLVGHAVPVVIVTVSPVSQMLHYLMDFVYVILITSQMEGSKIA